MLPQSISLYYLLDIYYKLLESVPKRQELSLLRPHKILYIHWFCYFTCVKSAWCPAYTLILTFIIFSLSSTNSNTNTLIFHCIVIAILRALNILITSSGGYDLATYHHSAREPVILISLPDRISIVRLAFNCHRKMHVVNKKADIQKLIEKNHSVNIWDEKRCQRILRPLTFVL